MLIISIVHPFGQHISSTYSSLADNVILRSNTTLYCVTEIENTTQVNWSYIDLTGVRSDINSTTDANTGISTLQVYTTQSGYYMCEVTEDGGMSRVYTVGVINTDLYTGKGKVYTVEPPEMGCLGYFLIPPDPLREVPR